MAGVGGGCAGGVEARLRGVLLLLLAEEVVSAAADDGTGLGVFRLEPPLFLGVSASGDCVCMYEGRRGGVD